MKRARHAAPITLAAALAAFAALAAACGPKIIPIPNGCPREEPAAGAACAEGALCAYGDDTCTRTYACVDGAWQSEGDGCVEPPPPPGMCPTALPTMGAPCKSPGQTCQFTFPGACEGVFDATCSDAKQWTVTDNSPPCMPPECPPDEPPAGAPCTPPLSCTYTALPPGCPPETHDATCASGVWEIKKPDTCVMP